MSEPTAEERGIAARIWCESTHANKEMDVKLAESIATALHAHAAEARSEERARCAKIIPITWLDPLLSGPFAALRGHGPWGCQEIERLLQAMAVAIQKEP